MNNGTPDPFKGLARFEATDVDAALFFGRERDREIIVANLVASRLTVLYGASGVGKSSLLRAGVAHHLRSLPEPLIAVVFDAWQSDPVERLKRAVAEAAGIEPARSLGDTLDACATVVGGDVFVLLDQVDEYFLYHRHESGPGTFAEEFSAAVAQPGLRASFLLALREETVAKLDSFKGGIPNVLGNYLRLEHLDRVAGYAAILGPIEYVNRHVSADERLEAEPALVEEVLDEVTAGRLDLGQDGKGAVRGSDGDGRIETPYLQLVMQRLWTAEREAGSRTLRLETLRSLGGAEEIVRDRLRSALDALSPEQQDVTAALFNQLVTPSGTKIAHGPADLAEYAHVDEAALMPVLSQLAAERILRPVADESGGERYEIYHDVLAEAALGWKRTHDVDRELEQQREEAGLRHRRLVTALVAAGLLVAVMAAVTVFALTQRSHARSQARVAHARELAATAVSQLPVDPQSSLALAIRSLGTARTNQGEDVLRTALVASRERAVLPSDGPVRTVSYSPDGTLVLTAGDDGSARIWSIRSGKRVVTLHHGGHLTGASFSPDGRLVLTTSDAGTARLWRVGGGLVATLRHNGPVTSGSFGPGGRLVLTTSKDGTARIWNPAGRELRLIRHGRPVLGGSISPGGRLLVTVSSTPAGKELRARIYSLPSGRLVRELPAKGVTVASFDPSGKLLVTGGIDHTAAVWQVATGRRLHLLVLADRQGAVTDAVFGPKGRLVATTSSDAATRVWDVRTGNRLAIMLGHTNAVNHAAFSNDGRFLVTTSDDGTARIWDAGTGRPGAVLHGHSDAVTDGAFAPDGRTVATAGADGTARVWDPGTAPELRFLTSAQAWMQAAAFSPDGREVLAAERDGRVRILDSSGRVLRVLESPVPVTGAVFSLDGRLVIAAGTDRTVRVWRTDNGTIVRTAPGVSAGPIAVSPNGRLLAAPTARGVGLWDATTLAPVRRLAATGGVAAVTFSPDGKLVATAGKDGVARILDARTGSVVRSLHGHTDALTGIQFSPDGKLLVTSSRDHDARIWDVATGRPTARLPHFGPVFGASFSPDGRWVVTAGPTTAGLWQVSTGSLLLYLHGHTEPLTSASFSPDGKRILTSSRDGTVRTYTCEACGGVDALLAAANGRLAAIAGSGSPG